MDKFLPDIASDLRRLLEKTQRTFADRSVSCPEMALAELATVLVEFAEDIHAEAGLWRSLEDYNREFFRTPLPLSILPASNEVLSGFDPRRIHHLIWTLWMNPELLPSPGHPNLIRLADVIATFLTERFAGLPRESGVKAFLGSDSRFGWQIKRKLVWVGTRSYMFRFLFRVYASEQGNPADIGVIDDFICQQTTVWSGLGTIDILAAALDGLTEQDRATLRTWYELHAAFYRVLSRRDRGGETESLVVRNLVNRKPYSVRMNMANCPFQPGWVVFGSLMPWRGEWYWSGEQRTYGDLPKEKEATLRAKLLEDSPVIAYRYCPAEAAKAREINRKHWDEFIAHCGSDLVVYPDGLTLAAAEQKRAEAQWHAADRKTIQRVMRERGLQHPRPAIKFPQDFLDHDEGIGAFFDPDEGEEFMLGFNYNLSGLRKRGKDLSDTEREALEEFITGEAISPAFVHRVIQDHGAESLLESFQLQQLPSELGLQFLLRCFKGAFYRNRYPSISLLDGA